MRRILVIRLRRLGDVLTSTPLIRALRRRHPAARIDALVSRGYEEALAGNPNLDAVYALRRGLRAWIGWFHHCRRARYDTVYDLQGSPRSMFAVLPAFARTRVGWKKGRLRDWIYTRRVPYDGRENAALKKLRLLGPEAGIDPTPDLAIAPLDEVFARQCVVGAGPVVALSVVARDARKQWSAENYARLADRLVREQGVRVLFTRGPGELPQVEEVIERMRAPGAVVAPPLSLTRLAAVYRQCDLWIGNDGGPKHVAVAAGCPVVMLIGSYCAPQPAGCREAWVTPRVAGADVNGVRVRDAYRAADRLLAIADSKASPASDQV